MVDGYRKVPCVIQRGGTSKGVFLLGKDLPQDAGHREKIILSIFGSPDRRQIDGLGGADPLTSKVAIISPSNRSEADVDYTFGAVDIDKPIVDFNSNCGNISAGVGPFAIDEGLVKAKNSPTVVRIFNTNTEKILKAYVPTANGKTQYWGNYAIDGVPGTSAKIMLDFSETEGAVTGKLLPTGNPVDVVSVPGIGDVEMSIIDAGNPGCYIKPEVLNLTGIEGPLDKKIIDRLDQVELIRGTAAKLMGVVDDVSRARVDKPSTPFIAMVGPPENYRSYSDDAFIHAGDIDLVLRPFYMQEMHKAIGGTMTVCTSAAAKIEGTLVHSVCVSRPAEKRLVRIGHASGIILIEAEVDMQGDGPHLTLAAFGRTSRRIMEGFVYVPQDLF